MSNDKWTFLHSLSLQSLQKCWCTHLRSPGRVCRYCWRETCHTDAPGDSRVNYITVHHLLPEDSYQQTINPPLMIHTTQTLISLIFLNHVQMFSCKVHEFLNIFPPNEWENKPVFSSHILCNNENICSMTGINCWYKYWTACIINCSYH